MFDAFAEVAKALGNGRRAELIDVLAQGERHVEELAAEIGQSVANTSFHLRALATAGLVTTTARWHADLLPARPRRGSASCGRRCVTSPPPTTSSSRSSPADYLGDRSALEQIGRAELAERIAAGDVVVVDVRPAAEYAAGHIASARSIPIDRLAASISQLPADVEVVAYCRGPYCVFADDAVRLLRRRGRRARRLEDGYPEWQRASLPVEATAAP